MNKFTDKKTVIEKHAEQKKLHAKYNIEENVVIKETPNMTKFFIKYSVGMIRILISIMVVILAAIGIITIAYPELREEFLLIIRSAVENLR